MKNHLESFMIMHNSFAFHIVNMLCCSLYAVQIWSKSYQNITQNLKVHIFVMAGWIQLKFGMGDAPH